MAAILDPSEGGCRGLGFDTVRRASRVTSRIGYMPQGFTLYGRLKVAEKFAFAAKIRSVSAAGLAARRRRLPNADQTYTAFMVLSMAKLAALLVGVIYRAASIVREKEAGTIEQLRMTPIGTGELFLAKTLPTHSMGPLSVFPNVLIVWWFGVPLRGSLLLFLALAALFRRRTA